MNKITLIGGGLAGALCALYLARRGYEVEVFESRTDPRKSPVDYGRSINLALSCRGLTGLKAMDLLEEVQPIMVPMRARAIHEQNGSLKVQPFGRHAEEYINAISRSDLQVLLLNKAQQNPKIHLHFDRRLEKVDLLHKKILFHSPSGPIEHVYEHLIGADGASSQVREAMKEAGLIQAERDFLSHGYKELSISKKHAQGMIREHLHLWPRDAFMLLGNPNPDDSITGSLFLANEGKNSFASLKDEASLIAFFSKAFPDAYRLMPHLVEEFFRNPTGSMSTIRSSPWYYKDECLLIGDAAHGVIPFFGQGMNSAFEDCRILDGLLDQYHDDWYQVMPQFYQQRKINTDAVANMSMDNYHEIHSDIRHPEFILKKRVEHELMHRYPNHYVSKHVLVMFTNTPYAEALEQGRLQSELLEKICAPIHHLDEVNWKKVDKLMQEYDKKLAQKH